MRNWPFLHEVLARTPANIPVMGWPMSGDTRGITEYEGVRLLSEYGKFVPGTEFCSNLSVHTALHPQERLFRQKAHVAKPSLPLDSTKIYITLNILDSGDALWYWQRYQRKIWADPDRGALPIGWCMNTTLWDTMPLVMQWYFQHATPADTFFAAVSGLGYMNTQVYASRFRAQDRERIWSRYVALTDTYRRRADMHGIALYNGGWGETTPPPDLLQRFTHNAPSLDYIFADLGRHDKLRPADAAVLQDGVAVFHTLTRYQVWSNSSEVSRQEQNRLERLAAAGDRIAHAAPAPRLYEFNGESVGTTLPPGSKTCKPNCRPTIRSSAPPTSPISTTNPRVSKDRSIRRTKEAWQQKLEERMPIKRANRKRVFFLVGGMLILGALSAGGIYLAWPRPRLLTTIAHPVAKVGVIDHYCWVSATQLLLITTEKSGQAGWNNWQGAASLLNTVSPDRHRLEALTDLLNRTSSTRTPEHFEISPDGTWLVWETLFAKYGPSTLNNAHLDGTHYRKWLPNGPQLHFFLGRAAPCRSDDWRFPDCPARLARRCSGPKIP